MPRKAKTNGHAPESNYKPKQEVVHSCASEVLKALDSGDYQLMGLSKHPPKLVKNAVALCSFEGLIHREWGKKTIDGCVAPLAITEQGKFILSTGLPIYPNLT